MSETSIVPDFGDPDECEWCGEDAHGVTRRDDGIWAKSCGGPFCNDDGPYQGAR